MTICGNKNLRLSVNRGMIPKILWASTLSQFLMAAFLALPHTAMAQASARPTQVSSFLGTWKGICADGKDFVIVTLNQNGSDVGGTVSIANTQGQEGQCDTVLDPPSPEHAMKISSAQLRGTVLSFQTSRGPEFEMTIVGNEGALLKFLGTPVEDTPWQLKKAK
jgi:hypothetical protein